MFEETYNHYQAGQDDGLWHWPGLGLHVFANADTFPYYDFDPASLNTWNPGSSLSDLNDQLGLNWEPGLPPLTGVMVKIELGNPLMIRAKTEPGGIGLTGISGQFIGTCGKAAVWNLNPDGSLLYVTGKKYPLTDSYDKIINNTGKTLTFKCVDAVKCIDGVIKPGGTVLGYTNACPSVAVLTWVEK